MKDLLRMQVHQARAAALALGALGLCGAALTACGDDEKPAGEPSGCAHDVLEADLEGMPFVGPAVDPATGDLLLEEGGHYVVSSTYGVPKGTDGVPTDRYLQLFGAVQAQLGQEPGLLAMTLASSNECGSGRTLAVWRSEEEMYDFVTSQAHLDAMAAAPEILQPGYAVTHWDATSPDQVSFAEAIRQLAKVDATQ